MPAPSRFAIPALAAPHLACAGRTPLMAGTKCWLSYWRRLCYGRPAERQHLRQPQPRWASALGQQAAGLGLTRGRCRHP